MQVKKKASSQRKEDLRIAWKKYIFFSFVNQKRDIFVILTKLNISLQLKFDSHRNK